MKSLDFKQNLKQPQMFVRLLSVRGFFSTNQPFFVVFVVFVDAGSVNGG